MTLEEMRTIVNSCMPYDTGFMFLNGAKYTENAHFLHCRYDVEQVPYIIYNEEGTVYTQKNKGFIREKTIGALMAHESGQGVPFSQYNETVKRRASTNMIKQGAMDKIRGMGL